MYDNAQNKTPILGLRFENTPISFSTQKSLEKIIAQKAEEENKPLLFSYNNTQYLIYQNDIGYTVNPEYTTNAVLLVGRKGTFLQKLTTQFTSLFGLQNIQLSGNFSRSLLTLKLLEMQNAINQNPTPIHPDFVHDITRTLPASSGFSVNSTRLTFLILHTIAHPTTTVLPIPVDKVQPTFHTQSELSSIREQATKLITSPVSIASAGQIFTLSPEDLKNLLTIVERPDPQNPSKTKLVLRLDDTKLVQKLDGFAAKVELLTNTEFNYEDALASIYGQFYFNKRALSVIPTGNLGNTHVLGAQTKPGPKIAYITFDDGPNTIYHPLILDILRHYNVKATFFLIGQNVVSARDVATQTYKDGHLIGNHTLSHAYLPNYSSAFILNEMAQTSTILKTITGAQPINLFRPPFGGINATVLQDAHQLGMQVFLWDVDPRDWAEPPTNILVQRVVNYVHSGSNVLLHSNHIATVKALPQILQTLIAQGYTFETLDKYPRPEEL